MKLLSRLPRRDRRSGQNRRKTDLTFDLFEDRVLLTAYTVNDAADTLSGTGDTGTLRYIIHQLSVDGTATNDIKFAIPGPGVQTITLGADLDPIQRQVTIEGYTQTGASKNSQSVGTNAVITIQLNLNGHQGLVFQAGATTDAAGSIVQGLAIFGGSGAAIDIQTNSITVSGNFLGVKADGTTAGAGANGVSVATGVTGAVIGSTANVDRNLISGNTGAGLSIAGTAIVQGNLIGTDRSGLLAVGNQDGLLLIGSSNTIGGTSAGAGNLISGNAQSGIRVDGSGNLISGNSIGLNASGGALPNSQDGVRLEATAGSNTIGGTSPGAGNCHRLQYGGRRGDRRSRRLGQRPDRQLHRHQRRRRPPGQRHRRHRLLGRQPHRPGRRRQHHRRQHRRGRVDLRGGVRVETRSSPTSSAPTGPAPT